MKNINQAQFKRVIGAMKDRRPNPWEAGSSKPPPTSKYRRAAIRMFESFLSKAGLDVGKLKTLLAQDRDASRRHFEKQKADAAKHFSASEAAFQQGIAARRKALELLAVPFTPSYITLDKPFLIWQLPHPQLDIFIDSHIESLNSSVNILIKTSSGSDDTKFTFYFPWENESDNYTLVNVATSLVITGGCSLSAAPGIFSGDQANLQVTASLGLLRWSGWGTGLDHTDDPDFPQFPQHFVTNLQAKGGHIFQGPGHDSKMFSFEPFDLSHNLLIVPGKAIAIFKVTLEINYWFDGGLDLSDQIIVDFSNNGNSVRCPLVQLEVLTPRPSLLVA